MDRKAWDSYHRRGAVIDDIVGTAEATGDFHQPWRHTPTVWEEYHDVPELLRDLQTRFHTTLLGALDQADEDCEGDAYAAAIQAYRSTVLRHRGIRRIIEANALHPVLAPLLRAERTTIASMAGVSVNNLALPSAELVQVPRQRHRNSLVRRRAASFA